MECKETQKRLGAYLDGELSGDIWEQMQHHLERCDRCSDVLARQRRLRDLLNLLPRQRAPERFARHVRNEAKRRLGSGQPPGILTMPRRTPVPARVAAVLALVAGVTLGGLMGATTAQSPSRAGSPDLTSPLLNPLPPDSVSAKYLDWMEQEK